MEHLLLSACCASQEQAHKGPLGEAASAAGLHRQVHGPSPQTHPGCPRQRTSPQRGSLPAPACMPFVKSAPPEPHVTGQVPACAGSLQQGPPPQHWDRPPAQNPPWIHGSWLWRESPCSKLSSRLSCADGSACAMAGQCNEGSRALENACMLACGQPRQVPAQHCLGLPVQIYKRASVLVQQAPEPGPVWPPVQHLSLNPAPRHDAVATSKFTQHSRMARLGRLAHRVSLSSMLICSTSK